MKKLRRALDAAMTALLPCLMAYALIGETFHEIAGVVMFALFLAHHILNRAWFRGLFRGRYSPYRMFSTAVNLLLCAVMLCLPLSGILMSRHLFRFLPAQGVSAAARTVHLLCSYWGYVLMCLHLGLHVDAMPGKKPKWLPPAAWAVSLYGLRAFVQRGFPGYMTLRTQFVFFDYGEPLARFLADYLAVMVLFVTLGAYIGRGLKRLGGRPTTAGGGGTGRVKMTDTEQIQEQYRRMYDAMIRKDGDTLAELLDDGFVLVHMTGLRQDKAAFLRAVADGTLNYFYAQHEQMPVKVSGDLATLTGQSRVTAAVFGGGRHTWRLQQKITFQKQGGVWRMTESIASTY